MIDSLDILRTDNYIEHHGVLGMKWGVRHDKPKTGRRSKSKSKSKARWNTADSQPIAPPRDMVKDCKEVNDGMDGAKYGFNRNQNCFFCSMAYELRQRGYNVQAKSSIDGVGYDFIDACFKNEEYRIIAQRKENELHIGLQKEEYNTLIKDIVKDGDNTRGMVLVSWQADEPGGAPQGGHAMNYEVRNGIFYLIDGQTGDICTGSEAYEYLKYSNNVITVRTDNVEIDKQAEIILTENDATPIHKDFLAKVLDKAMNTLVGIAKEIPVSLTKNVKSITNFVKKIF